MGLSTSAMWPPQGTRLGVERYTPHTQTRRDYVGINPKGKVTIQTATLIDFQISGSNLRRTDIYLVMAPQDGGWTPDAALQPTPSSEFRIFRKESIVKIELTRPKSRNSLTSDLVSGLRAAYGRIARDSSIFRVYLTGQGKVFCAGMNLTPPNSAAPASESVHLENLKEFRGLLGAIEDAPQVTIALINGPCYGGGNGLAFANDIRICVRDATFSLTEVKLGLAPCAISPVLAREWGLALCRAAMLTARPVAAEELKAAGAIYALADDVSQLTGSVLEELEKRLQACAPGASAVCKELVGVAWTNPGGKQQDELVAKRYVEMMTPSREARHGIQQFKQGIREVDWAKFWDAELGKGSRL